jgi:hypothetical protein
VDSLTLAALETWLKDRAATLRVNGQQRMLVVSIDCPVIGERSAVAGDLETALAVVMAMVDAAIARYASVRKTIS